MHTNPTDIWKQVERSLGKPVPENVRSLCAQLGWLDDAVRAPGGGVHWRDGGPEDWDLSSDEEAEAEETLAALTRHAGILLARISDENDVPVMPQQERWQLLYEIGRRFNEKFSGSAFAAEYEGLEPLRIRLRKSSATYPPSDRIVVDFDSRMSRADLFDLLERLWPWFREQSWTRSLRIGERSLALVRFVCLESPEELTWRERLDLWNQRFPEWSWPDVRNFNLAFRRVEEQITGAKGGLWPMYHTREEWERRQRELKRRLLDQLIADGLAHPSLMPKDKAGTEPESNRGEKE